MLLLLIRLLILPQNNGKSDALFTISIEKLPLLFKFIVHHSPYRVEAWFPLKILLAASPTKDYLSIISNPCLSRCGFFSVHLQTSCFLHGSFMAACSPHQVPSWLHGTLAVAPAILVRARYPAGPLHFPFLVLFSRCRFPFLALLVHCAALALL